MVQKYIPCSPSIFVLVEMPHGLLVSWVSYDEDFKI